MSAQQNIAQPADSAVQLAKELNLGPLQEPVAVPFTFETVGWPILAGIVIIAGLCIAIWQIRKYNRNRYRREALAELEQVSAGQIDLAHSFVILKRTAITAFSREKVGNLAGTAWLQFLEESGKKVELVVFEKDIENLIYKGISPKKSIEERLLLNTEKWIRTHATR